MSKSTVFLDIGQIHGIRSNGNTTWRLALYVSGEQGPVFVLREQSVTSDDHCGHYRLFGHCFVHVIFDTPNAFQDGPGGDGGIKQNIVIV